jgi:hypothetical protein
MTEKQKAVLEASDLALLDELKNGDLLVQDTEAMAIRGVYFCYILTKEGAVITTTARARRPKPPEPSSADGIGGLRCCRSP